MTKLFEGIENPQDPDLIYLLHSLEIISFIESLWQKFEPYADKNYRSDMQSHFHSRLWEMYLACSLIKQDMILIPKLNNEGPDLRLNINGLTVSIEAIAPENGVGSNAVPPVQGSDDQKFTQLPTNQIELRYCSAINEKFEKYKNYIDKQIISNDEPYVIAINGSKVYPIVENEIPLIVRTVLAIGDRVITIVNKQIVDDRYKSQTTIYKFNGNSVNTDYFNDPEYFAISGILFSNTNSLDHQTTIGTEFIFVRNKLAKNPLPNNWLNHGYEFWKVNDTLYKKSFDQ